nr:hypothetical protein [Tanacetum cinerariifolium]
MFRISPYKISREAKKVPNTVSASARTKPTTVSRPSVINKKEVNSDLNGLSSIGVDNTTKTRRTQLKRSSKNNKNVYSKVVCAMCKQCLISVNHDDCLLKYVKDKDSRGTKQKANVSIKETQKNQKPKDKDSRGTKQKANVSIKETQKNRKPKVKKPKNIGSKEKNASPKPRSEVVSYSANSSSARV